MHPHRSLFNKITCSFRQLMTPELCVLHDLLFKRNDGTEGRKDREETVKNCTGIATGISFTGPLLLWNSVQRVPGVRVQQGFSGAAADSGGDQFVDEEFAQTVDLKSHSQAVL